MLKNGLKMLNAYLIFNAKVKLLLTVFLFLCVLNFGIMAGLTTGSGFGESTANATFHYNAIANETPHATGNASHREVERVALKTGSGLSKSIILIGSIKETAKWSADRVTAETPPVSGFTKSIEAVPSTVGSGFPASIRYNIAGMVYYDADSNGIMDNNEIGLANWTVNLEQPSGTVINKAITDASGKFTFEDLAADEYTVSEIIQTGWILIAPADGKIPVVITNESITDLKFANYMFTNSTIIAPGGGFSESIGR
jgi:hypothetical protein